ncbi:MAG TPA: MFS transporter, partial [Anaerolineaceae bacterium]|nr:MFS transporter [Anaerolineaceae bacterium]
MQTQTSAAKLSLSRKLAYGVGDLGANLVFNAVSFYLLYYLTDISLLAASLAGLVLTLVRLIDAFTDPLIGYLSDRLQSPWGRRRPLIFFGAFPVGIFFYLLFAGSPVQGQMPMFFYFLAIYAGFFIAYSVVNVPYSALTPDMTKDFNERTSLTGYRMAAAIVGTLIAAGATKALTGLFPTERGGFAIVAAIYGVVFIVMTQVVFWGARGFDRSLPRVEKEDLLKLYRSALANKPFVLIAVTYILR